MQQTELKDKTELLVDYIMKNCLWQFHSRTWDRQRQNTNIIGMTGQILSGEAVDISEAENRCYFVDAALLAEAYTERYPWIGDMSKEDLKELIESLYARIDFLTVTGSLNLELNDPHY